MNFYRHWYGQNECRYNLLQDISNLGFYSVETNDPCEDVLYLYSEDEDIRNTPNLPSLYWNKDTLHKCYLICEQQPGTNSAGSNIKYYVGRKYHIVGSNNQYAFTDSNAGGYWTIMSGYNGYVSSGQPLTIEITFLPLKNGGFLLNAKIPRSISNSYYKYSSHPTLPLTIMPREYKESKPSIIGILNEDDSNSYDPFFTTFIGLPPTNQSILNNYLYIISSYSFSEYSVNCTISYPYNSVERSEDSQKDLTPYFDLQTGNFSNSDFFKMHNKYQHNSFISNNKQYMNFNPNVCILSKVPYDNGFIDNLYYMVTCPTSGISDDNYRGIFFSFEGRNFVNIYGNMVLELPGY